MSGKSALPRLAVRTLLILVVALVLFDAALRFGLGIGNPVLIAPDAACSYITRPSQNVYRFFVHSYINRYGMRSDEVSPLRPPGVMRVLFVGDSLTYGTTHVDQKDLFTQIVKRGLPAIVHQKVEVLNASGNGWAPENEWQWVRTRGIFQANYVLLVLNDGDLSQPFATIDQAGDSLPQTRPATAINELFSRFIKPRILHIQPHQDPGDVVVPDDVTERANLQDLSQFDNLVISQHGQMILVFLPFRADIPQPAGKALSVLQNWSAEHNVPLMNLTSAIANHSVNEICIYDHTHFNAAGNAVIGQAILQQWPSGSHPE